MLQMSWDKLILCLLQENSILHSYELPSEISDRNWCGHQTRLMLIDSVGPGGFYLIF